MRDPDKRYYVYIMASLSGTLYIGVTNSVGRRCDEHKSGAGSSFTSRYKVDRLVYYEVFQYVNNAITREKQLKGWRLTVRDGCFATLNRVCTPNIGNWDSSFVRNDKGPHVNRSVSYPTAQRVICRTGAAAGLKPSHF